VPQQYEFAGLYEISTVAMQQNALPLCSLQYQSLTIHQHLAEIFLQDVLLPMPGKPEKIISCINAAIRDSWNRL
jgi:hypothetical protein